MQGLGLNMEPDDRIHEFMVTYPAKDAICLVNSDDAADGCEILHHIGWLKHVETL
jgi:hypothetical protein